MKGLYRYKLLAFAAMAAMFLHSGCVGHLEEDILHETEYVSFKAVLEDVSKPFVTKGHMDIFDFEEEDWVLSSRSSTKSSLLSSLDKLTAGVFGYVYEGEWASDNSPLKSLIDNHSYTFDTDLLDAAIPVRWSQVEEYGANGHNLRVFAYAPKDNIAPTYETPATDGSEAKGAPVIMIPDILDKNANGEFIYQNDIVVADNVVAMNYADKSKHRKEIPLDFEHIYTAIQFKAGFDCTIKSLTMAGIKTGGNYVIGSGWDLIDGTETYSMDIPDYGLSVSADSNIGDLILMLPQTISSDAAEISLTYSDGMEDKVIAASLKGVEWKQGKKITYTLMKESDREYIYMDLAAGEIKITGNNYTGYVFVNKKSELIKGTIGAKQKYYIYQSCTTDQASPNYKLGFTEYDSNNYSASGVFTKPSYGVVTYDNMLWSDYITDNDNVESVIEAWDNSTGANGNTGIDNTRAVRNVGRESTKNKITVSGSVGTCNMILDNVYCSYQYKGANRKDGSLGFMPTWNTNSSLTLTLIGDSRLGCLHYDNNNGSAYGTNDIRKSNTNFLIIQGEGSLTVADADFHTSGGGYYSNHYDSAIGNADNKNATFGIVINSGTVFAGTTMAENSSAIGAGGNGYGDVVINGGVVTAVASTTGTAIGGGIGYSDTGGIGYVEINGGNVYAYNHRHSSDIPSSAIGGAGSSAKAGSKGTVIITGGNVYAQSALGTAIGGGSSKTQSGGEGEVRITGGTVIAKSLSPISAGIGGGSTCTGGGSLASPNGGKATITIGDPDDPNKHPLLRTGSIGGGGTAAKGGTVGSAVINVYGGDIQAQFVMAQSAGNIFTMEGGLIRNSTTSDDTYYCIKENGGAVYMEQGTFTMKDGEIRACSADKGVSSKGGAVYIKGDENTSFTMKGGKISECRANADGGAVYLEGGSVTIAGGKIDGNVAYNGNGGAISILGGSFLMDGTSALITQNAAFNSRSGVNGNGGGIYISPASYTSNATVDVTLKKGSITGNSSDRNGGGVCVDMGGNNVAKLNVVVGEVSDGSATEAMKISENNAQIKGGGVYVNGADATVTLNDGFVLYNETSSYRVNPDITVDGGLVTLMKPGITTQVTVTFTNNAQYYTKGEASDLTHVQYVVAASNSNLKSNEFPQINEYYNTFVEWNTRRDGNGASYADGGLYSFNEDITLYAQWE